MSRLGDIIGVVVSSSFVEVGPKATVDANEKEDEEQKRGVFPVDSFDLVTEAGQNQGYVHCHHTHAYQRNSGAVPVEPVQHLILLCLRHVKEQASYD